MDLAGVICGGGVRAEVACVGIQSRITDDGDPVFDIEG
jgi:hypothetical protein